MTILRSLLNMIYHHHHHLVVIVVLYHKEYDDFRALELLEAIVFVCVPSHGRAPPVATIGALYISARS